MGDVLASFRELKGVGPATEGRLHAAGVRTWPALGEVLAALARTRSADPLGELSEQVAARSSTVDEDGNPGSANDELVESFILRVALGADAQALHSAVVHVRSQDEQPWPGWQPAEVIRFVEDRVGLTALATPAARADDDSPSPSRDHLVVLEAGKVIGGRRRSIALQVATERLIGVHEVEYGATLVGRALGRVDEAERMLGEQVGRAHPPAGLPLQFDDVDLAPGVQRLRLRLAVRLPSPRREAPLLELR
jgi:hypothetical protein